MLEKLEEIDEILAGFEDWMHGEDGNKCTHARKLIIEIKASNNGKPLVSGSACEDACKTVVNGYEGDGMEQMKQRDEVFYKACKEALQHCH